MKNAASPRISPYSAKDDERLMARLWSPDLRDNPHDFVRYVYPWGEKGTPLADFKGPRQWQARLLRDMTDHLAKQKSNAIFDMPPEMYREAVASGRGIGKSALVAMLVHWFLSTRLGGTAIVTANTETQLRSRTWAELGKWSALALNRHWFEVSATKMSPTPWFAEALQRDLKVDQGYYYAQAQTWSEENPDAFAGAHNMVGLMLVFDEASGIPKPIWTVAEGFFTEPTPYRFWHAFSNPRRNTGEFYNAFDDDASPWRTASIDSRTVEGTDVAFLQGIVDRYGEDSDEARVEVKGMFPRRGEKQFIATDVVKGAAQRELPQIRDAGAALIMGVDIARFGTDKTVFRWRQGRDARTIPPVEQGQLNTVQCAELLMQWIDKTDPDAVFVDPGNTGAAVIDFVRDKGYRVTEVGFGESAYNQEYANRRTEIWAEMREWLPRACIDDNKQLQADLTGPEFEYIGRDGSTIMLEPKDKMRKRGLKSPDHGDALALTFGGKVNRKDRGTTRHSRRTRMAVGVDYNPFRR